MADFEVGGAYFFVGLVLGLPLAEAVLEALFRSAISFAMRSLEAFNAASLSAAAFAASAAAFASRSFASFS